MLSKKDIKILKFTIIAIVISTAGWMSFKGFSELLNLSTLPPFTLIFGGIFIVWLVTKLGWKN